MKDIEKVNALREGILTKEQIDTLAKASIIPADTPAPVVAVFAATCAAHGLSPYKREIYLVKYGTQYNTIVGIDGLRAKAARTGQFAGKDDAQFNRTADGSYLTAYDVLKKGGKEFPDTCTITVYRVIGAHRVPFTKTVLWREYAPARLGGKWQAMPFNMLEKCAEAAALRMAFADETAGLHIVEEKEAFQDTTIQAAEVRPSVTVDTDDLQAKIDACNTPQELKALYSEDARYSDFADLFTARKDELAAQIEIA
jgi:phage recombination protein Bet